MTTLNFDIMELVGREVSRCRDEIINRRHYDSVVYVLRDAFRESSDSANQRHHSVCRGEKHHLLRSFSWLPPRTLDDDHDNRFIEDFKDLLFINTMNRARTMNRYDFLDPTWGWSGGSGAFSGSMDNVREPNATMRLIQVELYGDDDY